MAPPPAYTLVGMQWLQSVDLDLFRWINLKWSNPDQPYCRAVISPKVQKFQQKQAAASQPH